MTDFFEALLKWWPLLIVLGMLAWGAAMFRARDSFASKSEMEGQAKNIADHGRDIAQLKLDMVKHDERMRNLPSLEDFHQVANKLTELHGDQKAQSKELEGVRHAMLTVDRSVTRIENHLLREKKHD